MYRIDNVACVGNFTEGIMIKVVKFEKVRPIPVFKILSGHASMSLFVLPH